MLTINLDFYTDGFEDDEFGIYGKGRTFYPSSSDQKTNSLNSIYIVVEAGTKISKWEEPDDIILRTNIYRLLEHPKLSNILVRKANLVNIFRSTKSDESSEALKKYMNNIIPILSETLSTCHNLYWLDDQKYIRSSLSFDFCLNQAINFAYDRLRIMNLITNVTDPSGILNSQISNQLSDIATNDYRALGLRESNAVTKTKQTKKRKTKK